MSGRKRFDCGVCAGAARHAEMKVHIRWQQPNTCTHMSRCEFGCESGGVGEGWLYRSQEQTDPHTQTLTHTQTRTQTHKQTHTNTNTHTHDKRSPSTTTTTTTSSPCLLTSSVCTSASRQLQCVQRGFAKVERSAPTKKRRCQRCNREVDVPCSCARVCAAKKKTASEGVIGSRKQSQSK